MILSTSECAVSVLQNDGVIHTAVQIRHKIGVGGTVEDEVVVPPLVEHAVVRRRLVAVPREEYRHGGASADVQRGVKSRKHGLSHGVEMILDVDHQQGRRFGVRIPLPGLEFLVRRHKSINSVNGTLG